MRRKTYVASRGNAINDDWAALADQAFPFLIHYKTIASYAAVGSEMNPQLLEHQLSDAGIALALPCVTDATASPLIFARYKPADSLHAETSMRIPEPHASAERVTPNVVLVPLLAVDRRGLRLGQGKGYYDRTLRFLRSHGLVKAIGLAYDCQVIERVPDDPWDEALDAIVTPSGWVWCKA